MNALIVDKELEARIAESIQALRPFMSIDMGARLANLRAEQLRQQGGVIRLVLPARYVNANVNAKALDKPAP